MKTIVAALIAILLVSANAHAMRKSDRASSQAKKKFRLQYFNLLVNNTPAPSSNQRDRRIYDIDDLLSVPADIPTAGGRWTVHFSDSSEPPVNDIYIPAFPDNDPAANDPALDLVAFFSEDRPEGYYNFRFESAQNDTSGTLCIHYPGSLVVVRSSAPHFNPDAPAQHSCLVSAHRPAEFLLKTPLSNGIYTIAGFNPETDSAIDFNTKAPVLDGNGAARASGPILFRFKTPGEKKITLRVVATDITVSLHIFGITEPFVIPLNINDSNQNHIADTEDAAPFTDANGNVILDPDLFSHTKLPNLENTPIYKLLTAPEARLIYEGKTFTLTVSDQLRLCSPYTKYNEKSFHWKITRDQPLPDWFLYPYFEGITASWKTGDAFIELKLTDGDLTLHSEKWKGTVLHFQINHSLPLPVDNLQINNPINQIVNPAVIPILKNGEPPETFGAKFQLTGSQPKLLEDHADLLEWYIYDQNNAVIDFHNHRTSITLDGGTQPTALTIGVRLQWQTRDYLQFQKNVVHVKQIPLAFQFFSDGQDPADREAINACSTALEKIIPLLNIIGRQAGIVFTPPPDIAPANHWKNLHRIAKIDRNFPFYSLTHPLEGILPSKTDNTHFNFMLRRDFNTPAWWTGFITPTGPDQRRTFIIEQPEGPIAPENIASGVEYILTPELPEALSEAGKKADIGFYHYDNIPSYITRTPADGKEYTAALSVFPNTVHLNFIQSHIPAKNSFIRSWGFPPIAGTNTPRPVSLSNEAGMPILLTVHPSSCAIPILAPRQLNATNLSYSFYRDLGAPGEDTHKINRASREIALVILRSLGFKERSLKGDLNQYLDPAFRERAYKEKILLKIASREGPGKSNVFLHTITPATDPYYPPIDKAAARNILDPHNNNTVRIDALQAQLLHSHPLIQSANP